MVTEQSTIVAAGDLVVEDLGEGEAVVLDLASGKYFGVNEIGALIVEMVAQPVRVDEIISRIYEEYSVSADQLEDDVLTFVQKLLSARLVKLTTNGKAGV